MTYGLKSTHADLLTMLTSFNLNSSVLLLWPKTGLLLCPGKFAACLTGIHHKRMNLNQFPHKINVLIFFSKLYLILLQICGAGNVFWECWFPHLCDHNAGPLSLHLSARCSHASFWAKYIFREILSSKSYALLSQCTPNPLLTAFFTTFI